MSVVQSEVKSVRKPFMNSTDKPKVQSEVESENQDVRGR